MVVDQERFYPKVSQGRRAGKIAGLAKKFSLQKKGKQSPRLIRHL
jgi:hypothetical protein